MPWTVNSEIHPLWARGVSSSVSTSCHWAFNLLVSLTFLTLVETLTAKGTPQTPPWARRPVGRPKLCLMERMTRSKGSLVRGVGV